MAPAVPKKAQKLGRALKSAARFPGRGSGRNHFSPSPGEQPVVFLRVQVIGCRNLARARNGAQAKEGDLNPLVVVSLLNNRHHTPVLKRTPNPSYAAKDATFDFPIYLSLADRLGSVELVVWDRDTLKLKKEYVGEVALTLESWFRDGDENLLVDSLGFSAETNQPRPVSLVSTRANTHASGMAVVKLGFVAPPGVQSPMAFERVFAELVKRSRPSLVSAPPRFRTSWASKKVDYNFSTSNSNDIVGIVMLEIQGATDLPRLKNMTRTGFDMDPFVVISFSKKIFRTRIIRHSLNPTWDEKLLFHVRRYETSFKVQMTVLDWDKLSSNDHVGDVWLDVGELVRDAPQPDPRTGLYAEGTGEGREMKQFCMPLTTAKEMAWEAKHNPTISFRAKFQPYAELRQRFWAQYLKQYDTDDTGAISRVELTSMLDSLGSTLSAQTIDSFFTPEDELTLEESIQCLETELVRPACEKKRIDTVDAFMDRDITSTSGGSRSNNSRQDSASSSDPDDVTSTQVSSSDTFERVINIKNCPLCHRPRLNSKAEMDIITHLAICASQDWAKVDKIVVGNFVTASQAQRKWYTKVISKVSNGNYRIGANSANIIVQNRMTGQLQEEKMQVYVRLGIRLLYKGARGRMEGARARRLLKSLSIKQGAKYDSPESARDIPGFIEFHGLQVNEILEPISSFKTFNDFFYRKLKPSARPTESPDDPRRLVSAADCRLMVFETVSEATKLWIKGREFSIARLLGDAYRDEAERYVGGPLAIFRLAPQDYHRFHVPVDGRIGEIRDVKGEYYTVNPQAIRSALDVYGENVRKIIPIDSPQVGRVMVVCVGAMMVGSIKVTVEEGQDVKRGQELGYFAFGGSTIVVLFERGTVEWDEDLVINGRACLETLVRVGMGIGTCKRHSPSHSHSGRV
ncbi:phosphatidylserine decarboxylase-domain-containing protein [Suillus bovinus]|uniref:phosphatidylserine decarboxylase-domain-containing protein n=1 Tax=Suillus bovinus TaxID=48563 RepID=UPI001B86EFCE|nr:phosphatidylserine decarboxylase-domain-containing protein [Suillus bovinus]KAG2141147.1 phosphatidylserine decarboxylase-domain-containing protein [Suillus bovinus]